MAAKPALRPGVGETILGDYGLLTEIQKDSIGPLWVGRRPGEKDARTLVLIRPLALEQLAGGIVEEVEEAATWAQQLEHEALLPVTDLASDDERLAIVSQYVEGEVLSVLLFRANVRRQHFPVAVVLRIVLDVLEGLAFLHELEAPSDAYRFGTLSPENIYVGLDGRARILEPGVTAVLGQVEDWGGDAKRLAYRAPEQIGDGGELGPAADVFTAAAILWEMVGKRRLFAGSTAEAIGKNIAEHPIARVDGLKGPGIRAITEELANVVAQALLRSTDERLSSVQALASGVRGAGTKVAEHEEVARFVDELHGQTLLERHRKIEQAVSPARSSGPGLGAPSSPGAGGKPKLASPGPFAATPSSQGKDDPEAEGEPEAKPRKDSASSRVLLGRKPAPPRRKAAGAETKGAKDDAAAGAAADGPEDEAAAAKRQARPKPPKRKKPAADQAKGAPSPPKRGKAPPKKEPPLPEDDGDEGSSSRKESAVVTMPASRSQLARRRRPSQEKMKAALPGSKASKSVKPPPPDEGEARADKGETGPAALGDDEKRGDERDVAREAPAESTPGDDGKPAEAAAKSGPGAEDETADEADVAEASSQPEAPDKAAKDSADESAADGDEASGPGADEPGDHADKPAAKAGKEPKKPGKDGKPKKAAAEAKEDRKPNKAATKPKKRSVAPVVEPAEAAAVVDEEPKSRLPMLAALAAVVVAIILVFAFRSGSDTSPAPGAGAPSTKPTPVPPGPTTEPAPTAAEPVATADDPDSAAPVSTVAAPAVSTVAPKTGPAPAPTKEPAPVKTAPPADPRPPTPPPPKPPPVKPPPPKPPGEFDPGGI